MNQGYCNFKWNYRTTNTLSEKMSELTSDDWKYWLTCLQWPEHPSVFFRIFNAMMYNNLSVDYGEVVTALQSASHRLSSMNSWKFSRVTRSDSGCVNCSSPWLITCRRAVNLRRWLLKVLAKAKIRIEIGDQVDSGEEDNAASERPRPAAGPRPMPGLWGHGS